MTYDNRTPAHRAVLDAAMLKKLGKRGRTRGDLAQALGIDPRMASDSLRRLVADAKATRSGPRNTPIYSKASS